jgi:molecular chaperone HscB
MNQTAAHKKASLRESLSSDAFAQLDQSKPDYYLFFGIPQTLTLDTEGLRRRFYDLSRKLHPDRFARSDEASRMGSIRATSILNDGYRTLKDRLSRAEYVLERHGMNISEQNAKNVPPELLEEVFELNMALEEMKMGDDDARPQLVEARAKFGAMLEEIDGGLDGEFAKWDENNDGGVLTEIRSILNRRRYIRNLLKDVESALDG